MKERTRVIIQVIGFSLIPSILQFLATSDSCLDDLQKSNIIGSSVNIVLMKNVLLILSIILSAILLSINLAYEKIENIKVRKQRDLLIKSNKDIFIKALCSQLELDYLDMNIRIFVPYNDRCYIIKSFFAKLFKTDIKKIFVIKNIEYLSESNDMNDLKFEVYPNAQGLVGQCYKNKSIIYDENLKHKSKTNYNLTQYQKNKICDLEFSLCSPIFNSNDDIIAIVEFDSNERIPITKANKDVWKIFVTNYCQFIYDYIPDLFK